MKLLTAIFYFYLFFLQLYGGEKFNNDLLKYPRKHTHDLENMFGYYEVEVFKQVSMVNTVILENGYAKSVIINKEAWKVGVEHRKIVRVDIIFTKFPFEKEDWITNYYDLLADRLSELFKLDPSLNNDEIQWNLVLQTACKSDYDARKFFHGILIKYEMIPQPVIEPVKPVRVKVDTTTPEKIVTKLDTVTQTSNFYMKDSKTNDYPEFKKRKRKKKKTKLKELPDCPDFNRKRIFGIL